MKNKTWIIIFCMIVLIIGGCVEKEESSVKEDSSGSQSIIQRDGLICEHMDLGWIEEFSNKYDVGVKDAAECQKELGLVIVMQLETCNRCGYGVVDARDLAATIQDNLFDIGIVENAQFHEQVCDSSGNCISNLISYNGKSYGVYGDLLNRFYLLVVKSEDPNDVKKFWQTIYQESSYADPLLGPVN